MIHQRSIFPGQQEGEKIYVILRQHWFYLFSKLLIWAVFPIVLVAINHYAKIYLPDLYEAPYLGYVQLFRNVYIILVFYALFLIWGLYYLNIQVITNQRIVDVSQNGIFQHTISELNVNRIEDVTAETRGFFATTLSFGNVYVQTAGTIERFVFQNIPEPAKIEQMISDLCQLQKSPPEDHPEPAKVDSKPSSPSDTGTPPGPNPAV